MKGNLRESIKASLEKHLIPDRNFSDEASDSNATTTFVVGTCGEALLINMQLQLAAMQQTIQGKTIETMSQSFHFGTIPRNGWNTTSLEYAEHIARIERMPSMITDAPLFPSVGSATKDDKVIYEKEWKEKYQQGSQQKHQNHEAQKKVHFTEHEKVAEVVMDGREEVFVEKDVNLEADGFIKQKHKIFDLRK